MDANYLIKCVFVFYLYSLVKSRLYIGFLFVNFISILQMELRVRLYLMIICYLGIDIEIGEFIQVLFDESACSNKGNWKVNDMLSVAMEEVTVEHCKKNEVEDDPPCLCVYYIQFYYLDYCSSKLEWIKVCTFGNHVPHFLLIYKWANPRDYIFEEIIETVARKKNRLSLSI